MFDLKVINSVLGEMEEERGIPREKMLAAMEEALATAYRKEFGQRGQIVNCEFDIETGTTTFNQVKIVVDDSMLKPEPELDEDGEPIEVEEPELELDAEGNPIEDTRVRFDEAKHIMINTAKMIKKDVELEEEMVFPLEPKDDFGRIAAQTAKQVIMQKVREAEKESALSEFGQKEGDIVVGHVQRFERGNLYVDLGRVTAIMPYEEQIPGERFKPGDRLRAILLAVEETPRGVFIKLSRSHPTFLVELFTIEAPELQTGAVQVKSVAREAGARTKIAVYAEDGHIDPVGSLVGQRGVRVSTVMSELGGEKIDIIEWSPEMDEFIEDSLSPAQVMNVTIEQQPSEDGEERGHAIVEVAPDQQSLAIGRGGQNVRLAAKLTGWKIDITSAATGEELAETDENGEVNLEAPAATAAGTDDAIVEGEEATTAKEDLADVLKEMDATKDRGQNPDSEEADPIDTPEEAEEELAPALDPEVVAEVEEETKVMTDDEGEVSEEDEKEEKKD